MALGSKHRGGDVSAACSANNVRLSHVARRKDQPGKVTNSCSWSAEQGKLIFLSPFAPEILVSRDGFGSPVPRQAESGAYGIPPDFRDGVLLLI